MQRRVGVRSGRTFVGGGTHGGHGRMIGSVDFFIVITQRITNSRDVPDVYRPPDGELGVLWPIIR